MSLEIQVLFDSITGHRIHLSGVPADVAAVLLANIHSQPVRPQFRVNHLEHAGWRLELLPIPAWSGSGHISPDIEQKQFTARDLVDELVQIFRKQDRIGWPDHVAQFVGLCIAIQFLDVAYDSIVRDREATQRRKTSPISKRIPRRRLDMSPTVIRMLARIQQVRIDPPRRCRCGM